MEKEPWLIKVEIRSDGVYRNGVKVSDAEAKDYKQRMDHDQKIHAPVLPRRKVNG
jgi:hypothetical protein